MLELSEKTVKISQTLILFKMNTTPETTPTAKVLTGKVPTTVGKISFLFILMLNFAFSFFSSLGRTIKKNAEKIADYTGTPVDLWNDFSALLEKVSTFQSIGLLTMPVEKVYEASYLLILYSVRTNSVLNVVTICLSILTTPYELFMRVLGTLGLIGRKPQHIPVVIDLNQVQTLTKINGVIVTVLSDTRTVQSTKDKFNSGIKKIISEVSAKVPFAQELNFNTVTLPDVQEFLARVISDNVAIEESLVTEEITERKEEFANVTGCTVENVLVFADWRKNQTTMSTSSEKYAIAKKVETAFRQSGLTNEVILGPKILGWTSVSEN